MRPFTHPVARVCLHLMLWFVVLYSTLPFLWTTLNSFKTKRDANARVPKLLFDPTLDNYGDVLLRSAPENGAVIATVLVGILGVLVAVGLLAKRIPFPTTAIYCLVAAATAVVFWKIPSYMRTADIYDDFLNTVIVCTGAVLLSVGIGSFAAYGLARYTGMSSVVILLAAIAFRSMPRMGYILPYYQTSQDLGIYDSYLLLIVVLVAINQPFTIWMLRAFFVNVPRELEEAAMVDGASRFGAFRKVVIPTAWPGIVATSLFTLLVVYHEFILVRILSQTKQTLTVAMTQYEGGVSVPGSIPRQSAASLSSVVPLIVGGLIFQKHFVKGIADGAVKG